MSVVPQPRPSSRPLLVLVAVVAAFMLVTGGTALVVWSRHADSTTARPVAARYQVSLFLKLDASDADKHAIEAALPDLKPFDGIHFETRQQAWQRFQQLFSNAPDMVNATNPESLPESYRLKIVDLAAVCPALHRIRQLPGVDDIVTTNLALRAPSLGPGPQNTPDSADC